ncbi:MAG: lamin tail domain-containing protein [Burkholderiaceae bacterium]
MKNALTLAVAIAAAAPAMAQVQITEWMYSGNSGEYIEFTNLGSSAVSFAGWVYDDDSRHSTAAAGGFDLSAFGLVGAGESVLITEDDAGSFRANWGLAASVKVLGNYTNNLGRGDEINLFDAGGNLVDRLAYGDQVFAGTIRAQTAGGTPVSIAALAPQSVMPGNWVLSATTDAYGSVMAASGDVGNPGQFILAAVPEPETYAMLLAGLGVIGSIARRRRAR